MYPPPPAGVLTLLLGSVVDVLTHARYTVIISFENGDGVTFSAPFRYGPARQIADAPLQEFPLTESRLIGSLGAKVVDVACEPDGTLTLAFSDDSVLVVYAIENYEAYTLRINSVEYLV